MRFDFLAPLHEDWQPVSKWTRVGWLVFFGLFLTYALAARGGFLLIDYVNLVVHEGGHLLFGWFGSRPGLWGGTLLQLMVPFALTCYFVFQRHRSGAAFAAFFFFENFLNIATYIADARAQALPLVTVGDPEAGGHDWFRILSGLGLLDQDTRLAGAVRFLGWLGMLATLGWFVKRARPR